MKKIIVCFVSILLSAFLSVSAFAAMLGDVTGDSRITASDARKALRAAVSLETLQGSAANAADITMDNTVTAADARLLLRVAVGLEITDGKAYADQFEVFRSGCFYSKAQMRGGMIQTVETATVDHAAYFTLGTASNALIPSFSVLMQGIDMNPSSYSSISAFVNILPSVTFYLLDRESQSYADISDEIREVMEQNPALLSSLSASALQSGLPASVASLSQANSVKNANFEGTACKAYDFKTDNGRLRYYMDGKRLLGVDTLNLFGIRTSRGVFETVSPCVSAELLRIPADYTETDGNALILSMVSGTAWETLLKK